jgi:hypothetical protein
MEMSACMTPIMFVVWSSSTSRLSREKQMDGMSKVEGEDISRLFLCLIFGPSDFERVGGITDESKTGFPA